MNDLVLFRGCIKVMSTIASHSPLNISETVSDRGLVPKNTNRKLSAGNHMTDDVTWPWIGQTRDPNTLRAQYFENVS